MERFLKNFFSTLRCLFVHPYLLDWKPRFQLTFIKADRKSHWHMMWVFSVTLIFIYLISSVILFLVRLPEYQEKKQFIHFTFHIIWILGALNILIHNIPILKHGQDVVQLANGTLTLIDNLETRHFGQKTFRKSQGMRFQILFGLSAYSIVCTFVVILPIFILFLEESFKFGHLPFVMLKATNFHLAVAVSLAVDMWYAFMMWGAYILTFHINLAFMHTFKTTIQLILMTNKNNNSSLSKLQETILIYSKLRILTTIFNGVYGALYILPIKSVFGSMIILSALLSVRLATQDDLAVRICGISMLVFVTGIVIVFLTFTAMVNEWSLTLENFLRQKYGSNGNGGGRFLSSKFSRRLLRAFKTEAVKSGRFYEIKKLTCLTVLGLFSNMTASALMSVKPD